MRRGSLPIVVLVGAAAMLAGCGGGPSERERVADYIRAVNEVQAQAGPALDRASRMYSRFAKGKLADARAVGELARAQDAIQQARDRVAALRPPDAARPLAARVLRVYDLTADLAQETSQLAAYLPRARAIAGDVQRRTTGLRGRLRGTTEPADQARALRAYAREVLGLRTRLRGLVAPPVLAATQRAQLTRLAASARLARRLAAAALARDGATVARLLTRFQRATAGTGGGRGLSRQEIRSYDARLRLLQDAVTDVNRAQAALQRQVR